MMRIIPLIASIIIFTSVLEANAGRHHGHHRPHGHGHHHSNSNSGGEVAAALAIASSLSATSYSIYKVLTEEPEHNKIIYTQAKEDAAFFIATQGEQTGVYLESAFKQLRNKPELDIASDMSLAEAILAI